MISRVGYGKMVRERERAEMAGKRAIDFLSLSSFSVSLSPNQLSLSGFLAFSAFLPFSVP